MRYSGRRGGGGGGIEEGARGTGGGRGIIKYPGRRYMCCHYLAVD